MNVVPVKLQSILPTYEALATKVVGISENVKILPVVLIAATIKDPSFSEKQNSVFGQRLDLDDVHALHDTS